MYQCTFNQVVVHTADYKSSNIRISMKRFHVRNNRTAEDNTNCHSGMR